MLIKFQDIKAQYKKIVLLNKTNNESLVIKVVASYKDRMSQLFGTHMKCLPPEKFRTQEENVKKQAIAMYHSRKTGSANEQYDSCLAEIEDVRLLVSYLLSIVITVSRLQGQRISICEGVRAGIPPSPSRSAKRSSPM